jgi:chloramphenicol 3-O phosphotransferase
MRRAPGPGAAGRAALPGLYDAIAAHGRLGLNVVADVDHHDAYSVPLGILLECARRLDGLPVLFVGVRCPLEVILERRRATGWYADGASIPPAVQRWQVEVHKPGVYDLELDTSALSPPECAVAIRRRLGEGPPSSAFERLAALAMTQD